MVALKRNCGHGPRFPCFRFWVYWPCSVTTPTIFDCRRESAIHAVSLSNPGLEKGLHDTAISHPPVPGGRS